MLLVLAVNRAGLERSASFSGHSRVVDCLGAVTSSLDCEGDGLLPGSIDTDRTRDVRSSYGSQLRDRRPDLYGAVVRPLGTDKPQAGI